MATTVIIRPTADSTGNFGGFNPPTALVGAATEWQAESDQLDTSYLSMQGGSSLLTDNAYELANPVINADQRCVRIRPVLRMKKNSSNTTTVQAFLEKFLAGVYQWAAPDPTHIMTVSSTTISEYRFNQALPNAAGLQGPGPFPANGYFEQADLDNLRLEHMHIPGGTGTNYDHRVYEAWGELEVWEEPEASFNAANFTGEFDIATPIPWTWIGNGEVQYGYTIRVFTDAQVGIGGFDPATSPATHEATVVSSSPSHAPSGLAYGTHYHVYLWVRKQMPSMVLWDSPAPIVEDFTTAPLPVATAIAPAGTIPTNRPNITWTASTGAGTQNAYHVKVFQVPGGGWGGFDPDTNTVDKVADSGEVSSIVNLFPITTPPLDNLLEHRAYVKLRRTGAAGGPSFWGDWAFSTFTTDFAAPPAPVLTTMLATNGVDIEVTVNPGAKNMLTANQASLETNTAGWTAGAAVTITRSLTVADHGVASLRLEKTGGAGTAEASVAFADAPVAVVGQPYTAQVRVRRQGGADRSVRIGLRWYTAAGATISTTYGASVATVGAAAWEDRTIINAIAPATTARVGLVVEVAAQALTPEFFHFDKMMVANSATITTWLQGSTPDEAYYVIERRTDGAGDWEVFQIGAGADTSEYIPPAEPFAVVDREGRMGLLLEYRAFAVSTDLGDAVSSLSSNIESETIVRSEVWVKDLYDSALDKHFYVMDQWLNRLKKKSRAIYRAMGRSKPIVVRGSSNDDAFSITFLVLGEDDELALEEIIDRDTTLFLQTPKGNWHVEVAADVNILDHLWDGKTGEEDVYQVTVPFQEVSV